MTTIDWTEVARRHLAEQAKLSERGTPPTDKTAETPISSVSSVGGGGLSDRQKRGAPLPTKPTKPHDDISGPVLRAAAEQTLHDDAVLRRAFRAAPQPDGLYRMGVAVRMPDDSIASAVLVNVNATWEQLLQALGHADNDVELFEERAGIREFDAGLRRPEAEGRALLDLMPPADGGPA
jgi:hypothetical protein